MENLNEIIEFYKEENTNKHKIIYDCFTDNVNRNSILLNQYNRTPGFGEVAFSWNWYLLIKDMPESFRFLKIGVFKGKVLALIKLISDTFSKNVEIYGIAPNANCIKESYEKCNLNFDTTVIIDGLSQDPDVIIKAQELVYDIIFIDGCHDYEVVCSDIKNYSEMLKLNGYLVLGDASSLLQNSYGIFLGNCDVGNAIIDILEKDSRFIHLYAVGHNRVWKKIN
jgi:hypothetical protein